MKWQPIETAPKDGTTILLWSPRMQWEKQKNIAIMAYWSDCGWYDGHGGGWGGRAFSHWMPLPEPPQEGE